MYSFVALSFCSKSKLPLSPNVKRCFPKANKRRLTAPSTVLANLAGAPSDPFFLKEYSLPSKFSYMELEFLVQGKLVIGNPCSGLNTDLLYVTRSIQQVRSLCQGKNTISNSKEASVKWAGDEAVRKPVKESDSRPAGKG